MSAEQQHDIDALIEHCRTGDDRAQIAAMLDLKNMGATEAVPAIIPLLESADEMVRSVAAEALGALGDEHIDEIGPLLERLVAAPAEYARGEAAHALGFLRYTPARAAIERLLLHDEEWVVRATAAEALGDMGDARAVDALEHALADEFDPVLSYVALAIGLVGDETQLPVLSAKRADEPDQAVQCELIIAMLRCGDESVFDDLLALLDTADDEVRVELHNGIKDMLSRKIPPVVIRRAAELDQRLATRRSPSLRKRLAELVQASSPAQP